MANNFLWQQLQKLPIESRINYQYGQPSPQILYKWASSENGQVQTFATIPLAKRAEGQWQKYTLKEDDVAHPDVTISILTVV